MVYFAVKSIAAEKRRYAKAGMTRTGKNTIIL